MNINRILDSIYPLSADSKDIIRKNMAEVSFRKGHTLLRADKVETSIYFIRKGIVRAFASTDHNEITFWFGKEGDTIISMKSYVANREGYENVELLEDCDLYVLKTNNLQKLYDEYIDIANWGRKFAEQELVKTEERLISRQFRTATERYEDLLKYHPDLIQRVQLGHIASYLGITRVSLSRIRADIK